MVFIWFSYTTSQLAGEVRIPSTMTGAQLKRLGPRGLVALCSDAATAEALQLALHGERQRDAVAAAAHRSRNARMTALGNHKALRRVVVLVLGY